MTRAKRPTVSTIIPVHNAADTIGRTIESLRAQTLEDWEAICVVDACTDVSSALLRAWSQREPRVRVIEAAGLEKPRGVAATRNIGLDVACGEYVHFLDADDTVKPTAYEKLVEAERRCGLGGAAGWYDLVGVAGDTLMVSEVDQDVVQLDDLIDRVFLWTAQHIVKRDRVGQHRYTAGLETYEDLDMWFRLAQSGVGWGVVRESVASYHVRAGSLSRRSLGMMGDAQRVWTAAFERSRASEPGAGLSDDSHVRWERVMMRAAVGCGARAALCAQTSGATIAARLMEDAKGKLVIPAQQLGTQSYFQVMLSLGVKPAAYQRPEPGWRSTLRQWWGVCEQRGWLDASGVAAVDEAFDTIAVDHDQIAQAIVELAKDRGAFGVDVIGLGRNGRLLAQHAAEAGLRVRGRDDGLAGSVFEGIERVDVATSLHEGWLAVVTPLADEGLAVRFPGAVRWREVPKRIMKPAAERGRGLAA